MNATLGDSNTDLTIDFAFVAAPPPANSLRESNTLALAGTSDSNDNLNDTTLAAAPETYLEWQSPHAPVPYTHRTLPTKREVYNPGVVGLIKKKKNRR